MSPLHILSGGAAQGLVTRLQDRFKTEHGQTLNSTFGAVGLMKDALMAGAPCDVLILTDALTRQLTASGQLRPGSARDLGRVKTGVAVIAGQPRPAVATPAELRAALCAATGIYFPDPIKSTAGIHFMKVLRELGLEAQQAGQLRSFANGATAMAAMVEDGRKGHIGLLGCTQITEIVFTPGTELVAALPPEFELATVYTAAVTTTSGQAQAAADLIELLGQADTADVRRQCGFA